MKYEGQKEYMLDICGYRLTLPVVEVAQGLHIASFVMLGAAEVTRWCAEQLAVRLKGRDFDYIVCPEAKVLPLAQSLCEKLGISEYIVLRKDKKSYMQNAVEAEVKSITTSRVQRLVADGVYSEKLRGKRVLLINCRIFLIGRYHRFLRGFVLGRHRGRGIFPRLGFLYQRRHLVKGFGTLFLVGVLPCQHNAGKEKQGGKCCRPTKENSLFDILFHIAPPSISAPAR